MCVLCTDRKKKEILTAVILGRLGVSTGKSDMFKRLLAISSIKMKLLLLLLLNNFDKFDLAGHQNLKFRVKERNLNNYDYLIIIFSNSVLSNCV